MRFRLHYVHVITYDVTNVLMLLNRLNRLHYGFEKFIYFCFQQKKIACIIEIIEKKLCHFFLSCTLCHFFLCHFFLVPFFPVPFFPVPFFLVQFFLHSSWTHTDLSPICITRVSYRGGAAGGIYPPHDFGKGGISPPSNCRTVFFLMGILVKSFKKVFRRQIPFFFSKFVFSNCPPPHNFFSGGNPDHPDTYSYMDLQQLYLATYHLDHNWSNWMLLRLLLRLLLRSLLRPLLTPY